MLIAASATTEYQKLLPKSCVSAKLMTKVLLISFCFIKERSKIPEPEVVPPAELNSVLAEATRNVTARPAIPLEVMQRKGWQEPVSDMAEVLARTCK